MNLGFIYKIEVVANRGALVRVEGQLREQVAKSLDRADVICSICHTAILSKQLSFCKGNNPVEQGWLPKA